MALSKTVETELKKYHLAYKLHTHEQGAGLAQVVSSLDLPKENVLRGVLLREPKGKVLLAVLPLDRLIDFQAIERETGLQFSPLPIKHAKTFFPDCAEATIPPLAKAYRLEMLLDESVGKLDRVYFEGGAGIGFVELSIRNFLTLSEKGSSKQISCSDDSARLKAGDFDGLSVDAEALTPAMDAKKRLEKLYKLPAMPAMAVQIIKLRNDPNSDAKKLAEIVEIDPSLSAQVMRYANSSFFGFRGELDSIKGAISRVLGFDVVMNMALGLAAGGSLRNPPDGPLGLRAFWKHATYTAALAQVLSKQVPDQYEIKPGMAYLVGLLHNFGFLLLGHLFQPEFFLLNKMVAANPEASIVMLEKHALGMGHAQHVLGMGHAELGGWLMQSWKMPQEVIVTVKEHHNFAYGGEYEGYPALIAVINHVLGRHDIGDDRGESDLSTLCSRVGLDPLKVEEVVEALLEKREELDMMAEQFAA
jgi:HD-like signal output (HDOD) protein/prolyl-tRNA editing enzyme YbaK/EbsC (Cys-tRNA(Pro) deacylase)